MCLCYLCVSFTIKLFSVHYFQIFEKQILSASCKAKLPGQAIHNHPRLCYDVYHLSENVHSKLHCWMYAQRARTDNGCTPCFIITSTPVEKIPTTKNGN